MYKEKKTLFLSLIVVLFSHRCLQLKFHVFPIYILFYKSSLQSTVQITQNISITFTSKQTNLLKKKKNRMYSRLEMGGWMNRTRMRIFSFCSTAFLPPPHPCNVYICSIFYSYRRRKRRRRKTRSVKENECHTFSYL